MNDDILISKVKQICKKKPNERSNSDLQELQELTKNSKVFKSLTEANGESAHLTCCKYLIYEFCPAEAYLFKAGQLGTKFYIIISGKVGVEIPVPDHTGEAKFIEVVQYGKGGSFGELALESSKPRAASIKCKVPSHFVALEKGDFNRTIAKIVRDKRNTTVNFLQSLPIFSNITKGSLAKLTYNFREKDFSKGQIVYKEGDESNEIYLIIEGEFLFQKNIKVEDGRKKYLGDNDPYSKQTEVRKYRAKRLYKNLIQVGDIAKFGAGELFGVETGEESKRKYSCICNSSIAKVLCISKLDFFKRLKGEDIMEFIMQRNQIKEQEISERAAMWKYIAEENASSLSPIQLHKREKDIEKIIESEKLVKKLEKTATTPIFSKKMIFTNNNYLYKVVSKDLQKVNLSGKKFSSISPISDSKNHARSISSQKLIRLEKELKSSHRSITPLLQKTLPSGSLTAYPMNSKPIFEVLKYH